MKKNSIKIGILAFQGDVIEHEQATEQAFKSLNISGDTIFVRTNEDLKNVDALIIPGGESTVLYKLAESAGIFEDIKKIKNIFGTCAGAILLAKDLGNKTKEQKTLELMDMEVDRNAYGRQKDSFEENVNTKLGKIDAVFIRAPQIINIGKNVEILAKNKKGIIACEQKTKDNYYLATCFHPELTTTRFHKYFIKKLIIV